MIKIDKNIPVPPVAGRNIKYPFSQMKIGDSFVTECDNTKQGQMNVRSNIYYCLKLYIENHKNPIKITTRQEDGGKKIRAWRIK